MKMKDSRPYIFWAYIQWLDDSGISPHITIKNGPNTIFPPSLSHVATVTFNISSEAVQGLHLDTQGLSFSARFNGRESKIFAPLDCLLLLHSRDGKIQIDLSQDPSMKSSQKQQMTEHISENSIKNPVKEKPMLTLITGGVSDGIPRGKLTLVKNSNSPCDDPSEPERA